jgi:hypothetical protein
MSVEKGAEYSRRAVERVTQHDWDAVTKDARI